MAKAPPPNLADLLPYCAFAMNAAPANPLQSAPPIGGLSARHDANVPQLSVIIPCYDEADGLADLLSATERLRSAIEDQCELELLLVDDGSTDDTWQRMQACFGDRTDVILLRHENNRGIAAAIATGVAHARAEVVASLDADCTYDPLVLAPMMRLLENDVDMVVASPYHPAGGVEGVPAWRIRLSRLASRLYRVVLRNKLYTYTSCVRIYRRSAIIDLPLQQRRVCRRGRVTLAARPQRRANRRVSSRIESPPHRPLEVACHPYRLGPSAVFGAGRLPARVRPRSQAGASDRLPERSIVERVRPLTLKIELPHHEHHRRDPPAAVTLRSRFHWPHVGTGGNPPAQRGHS